MNNMNPNMMSPQQYQWYQHQQQMYQYQMSQRQLFAQNPMPNQMQFQAPVQSLQQFPGPMTTNARSQSYQSNASQNSITETVDTEYPLSLNRTISPSASTVIQKQDSDQMTELSSVSASTMPRVVSMSQSVQSIQGGQGMQGMDRMG